MNKRLGNGIALYALCITIGGVVGYFVHPLHLSTSLYGGLSAGILMLTMSRLIRRNILWAYPATLSALGVLSLTFLWRSVIIWQTILLGQNDYLGVGCVVTTLAIITSSAFVLFKQKV